MKPFHRVFKVCCLMLLLCLTCAAAIAEVPDISALTDDEIVTLLEEVNEALVSRGIEKTATLAKGAYIAGKQLPVGTYVYTSQAKGKDWGSLTVYSDGGNGSQLLWEVISAPDEGEEPDTVFVTLNEGDQLKSGVPFTLTIMPSVIFR